MIVEKYKINISTILSGTTSISIKLPISTDFQKMGQSELIQTEFVDIETEKAINTISDYEKVRFSPVNPENIFIPSITYFLTFKDGKSNYESIGFDNNDIKFEKNYFKQSFLNLNFYDSDNPLTQTLVSFITIFSNLNDGDLLGDEQSQIIAYGKIIGTPGSPKPSEFVNVKYILTNPNYNNVGFFEGYYLYDYKDELLVGQSKYLYMRASFKNAKTGKSTNLMVNPTPQKIDKLVHELYTRYVLTRKENGFYYTLDTSYHGDGSTKPNNIIITNKNEIQVSLYEIQVL